MKISSIFFTASAEIFEVYFKYTPNILQQSLPKKILTKQKSITNVTSTNRTNFVI